METRKIGDMDVPVLCLGTMTFGTPVGEREGNEIVRRALELGIRFIDTANMYEGYTRYIGSVGGAAEEILGRALKGSRRDDAVVATKVGMKIGPGAEDEGLSRDHIQRECDRSLQRLTTDRIDLYYMHKPDPETPLEESIATFAARIRAGKVRQWGVSNFDVEETREVLAVCDREGWPRPVAHQAPFSLLKREIEQDLLPLCRAVGFAVVPYQVLQGGLLTGKYLDGVPDGSRGAEKPEWLPLLDDEEVRRALRAIAAEADRAGLGLFEHTLRTTLAVPGMASIILGVKRPDQIDAAVQALAS